MPFDDIWDSIHGAVEGGALPYNDYGPLQTFDPHYDKVEPGSVSDSNVNDVASSGVEDTGPRRKPLTVADAAKMKPVSRREQGVLDNPERTIASKKEIEQLLAQHKKATSNQNWNNVAASASEAGMEFGHAFGGDEIDKNFSNKLRERGANGINNLKDREALKKGVHDESRKEAGFNTDQMQDNQSMDNTDLDMARKQLGLNDENAMRDSQSVPSGIARQLAAKHGIEVPDTADARSILNTLPFIKEDFDLQQAHEHEQESTKRTGIQQVNENKRNDADNAAGVAKAMMAATSRESIAGMRQQDQDMKRGERMIPGLKFAQMENGYIPSLTASNETRDVEGSYRGLAPIMQKSIALIKQHGRNFPLTKDWNVLKSQYAAMAQSKNKLDKNGVMNFNDMDNIMEEIGDPNSANQWISGGGLTRLQESFANAKIKRQGFLQAHGYEEGDMNANQIPGHSMGGAGGSSKSGNTLQPTRGDLNSMLGAAGLPQTATELGPKSPVPEPAVQKQGHGKIAKQTASFNQYEDGFIERRVK